MGTCRELGGADSGLGGDTRVDTDPERPVELHAIWSRGEVTPVVRRVLDVITSVVK